ncbi:MAG: hypothetical protein C4331_03185 [Meiothermus sp.]
MIAYGDNAAPVAVRSRIHWGGIFAGVLAGVVTYVALLVLGLAVGLLSAGTAGVDLGSLAIGGLIYIVIITAFSAYLAGVTTARAAGFLTPAQGRFNGLLTGMLMLILSTLVVSNVLSRGINTATNVAGSVLNAGAQAVGAAANSPGGLQGTANSVGLGQQYQALVSGFDRNELVDVIAQAVPELNQQQVGAAADVVSSVINNAARNISNNLGNLSNLGAVVGRQLDNVSQALQGPDFVSRLQRRGLSQAQAQEVAQVIQQRFSEARTQTQQTIDEVSRTAARAASTAAWIWLLTAGLILGLAAFGGGRGGEVETVETVRPSGDDTGTHRVR